MKKFWNNGPKGRATAFVALAFAPAVLGIGAGISLADGADEPTSVKDRHKSNFESAGIQSGPWIVRPSMTLAVGHDSNILQSGDVPEIDSAYVRVSGAIDARADMGMSIFRIQAELGGTWFSDADDLDFTDGSIGASVDHAITNFTHVILEASYNSSVSFPAGEGITVFGVFDPYSDFARVNTLPVSLTLRHDNEVWFIQGRASATWRWNSDRETASGVVVDQSFNNGLTTDFSVRAGHYVSPDLALFAEVGRNESTYDEDSADNEGWRYVGGIEANLMRVLYGEIYAGYQTREYNNTGDIGGMTYGANLTWFATELLSISLEASREFGAQRIVTGLGNDIAPVSIDRVSLEADWEVLRNFILSGTFAWQRSEYELFSRTDEKRTYGIGFIYAFGEALSLAGTLTHTQGESDFIADYDQTRVGLALTVAR